MQGAPELIFSSGCCKKVCDVSPRIDVERRGIVAPESFFSSLEWDFKAGFGLWPAGTSREQSLKVLMCYKIPLERNRYNPSEVKRVMAES
jgi:hypothetical protein